MMTDSYQFEERRGTPVLHLAKNDNDQMYTLFAPAIYIKVMVYLTVYLQN